jgi:predicted acetyltransferase
VPIDIRTITADEAVAFRRAVRAGFSNADTVDDADWARDAAEPLDRVYAAFDGQSMVATLRSFPTELTVPGGSTVRAGALTAVTCHATHRRQGLLTRMITADLTSSRDRGESADVLIASEYPIYGRFGYGPATETLRWELDSSATGFATRGSGTVEFVDNDTFRKEGPAIFERVRASRPGMIGRSDVVWDMLADLRRRPEDKPWQGFRVLVRDDDGTAQGWASYKVVDEWTDLRPRSTAEVADLCAAEPGAEARLWRFLADLDLVTKVTAGDRPVDDVLPWLLDNARAARTAGRADFLWVRVLDVATSLTARSYAGAGRLVVEVVDPLGLTGGTFLLDASADGAECSVTDESPDLTLPVRTLGAAYLGGARLATLHAGGWLDEHTPGSVARADALFAGSVAPWCNTWF